MAYVYVDIDLEEFSDDEIEREYEARNLGTSADPDKQYQRAYALHHHQRRPGRSWR